MLEQHQEEYFERPLNKGSRDLQNNYYSSTQVLTTHDRLHSWLFGVACYAREDRIIVSVGKKTSILLLLPGILRV